MRFGERNLKTVFLLGAGASRGALKHVLYNGKRIKPPLNGDFFNVADAYARGTGLRSAAHRRITRLRAIFKRDLPLKGLPTMEEAFSLLYIAKDFPDIYNRGKGRRRIAGVRKEIDDFLHLLFPVLSLLDRQNHPTNGYDRLAKVLRPGDTILTLNYDTLLDSALHRRGWDPTTGYGITGTKSKVEWPIVQLPEEQTPLRVDLIKLHGSMNWFVRGDTSDLKKVFSSKPVRITKPRTNEISAHIRQIAPPIYAKIFEHKHWQNLWTLAFKALCEAEVIVVVGCSLVDTDFHLRALFSQVARTRKNKSNKFKWAFFVDKTKPRRKWTAVLKGSYVRSESYSSFEKMLRNRLKV
jgi:SIR2-like domain